MIGMVFIAFASINLAYYIVHANGKKYVRLFSAASLYLLGMIFILQDAGCPEIIKMNNNPFLIVTSLTSVLDTIVDWRGKIMRGK